jgi:hypothetical protein
MNMGALERVWASTMKDENASWSEVVPADEPVPWARPVGRYIVVVEVLFEEAPLGFP